jgi:hypothetical protein
MDSGADVDGGDTTRSAHRELHRMEFQVAREGVLAMRADDEIGDDAFHRLEEELDRREIADTGESA